MAMDGISEDYHGSPFEGVEETSVDTRVVEEELQATGLDGKIHEAAIAYREAMADAEHPEKEQEKPYNTLRAAEALSRLANSGGISSPDLRSRLAQVEALRAEVPEESLIVDQLDMQISALQDRLAELEATTTPSFEPGELEALLERAESADQAATNRSIEMGQAMAHLKESLEIAKSSDNVEQRARAAEQATSALRRLQVMGMVNQHDLDETLASLDQLRLSIPDGHPLVGQIDDRIRDFRELAATGLAKGLEDLNNQALAEYRDAIQATLAARDERAHAEGLLRSVSALQTLNRYGLVDENELNRCLTQLEHLRLSVSKENPIGGLIDKRLGELRDLLTKEQEEIAEVPAASPPPKRVGSLSEMQLLFRNRLDVISQAMRDKTADWKRGLEVVKAFQRFQVLIGEYANEKSFDYSDREKFPELNELHDKMEASGILKWGQRGWSEKDGKDHKTLKTNLGLAIQIAMSSNKQDEIDASNLMNAYSTSAMFQMQAIKMAHDLKKFIIRAMSS